MGALPGNISSMIRRLPDLDGRPFVVERANGPYLTDTGGATSTMRSPWARPSSGMPTRPWWRPASGPSRAARCRGSPTTGRRRQPMLSFAHDPDALETTREACERAAERLAATAGAG